MKNNYRIRSARSCVARAVTETLEARTLMSAPVVLDPLPRDQRSDYIATTINTSMDDVSRLEWEYLT